MKDNVRYYAQAGFNGNNLSYKEGTPPFGSIVSVDYCRTRFSDTIYDSFQTPGEWRKTASGFTFGTENGRFKVTKAEGTAYYSSPNNDCQQSGTVEYSQYLIYDYKYINDGYVCLGFEKNGQRYYVQACFSDGQYSYKEEQRHLVRFIEIVFYKREHNLTQIIIMSCTSKVEYEYSTLEMHDIFSISVFIIYSDICKYFNQLFTKPI